jgi:hypothetical protein
MVTRIPQLRVKVKNLAAEAVIIRHDTKKHLKRARRQRNEDGSLVFSHDLQAAFSLREHRRGVVRYVARQSQLALAALTGTPYARCEQRTEGAPDLGEIQKLAERFDIQRDWANPAENYTELAKARKQKLETWFAEAKAHLVTQGFRFVAATGAALPPLPKQVPVEAVPVIGLARG